MKYRPNYKIINCLIFTFVIPICYTGPDAVPLLVQFPQQDMHLKNDQGIYVHGQKHGIIVHHINGNYLDNDPSNLLDITVYPKEIAKFGAKYSNTTKHTRIHQLLN